MRTTTIQGRVDISEIATVGKFYYDRFGVDSPATMSELVRCVIHDTYTSIIDIYPNTEIVREEDSSLTLLKLGLKTKERKGIMTMPEDIKVHITPSPISDNQTDLDISIKKRLERGLKALSLQQNNDEGEETDEPTDPSTILFDGEEREIWRDKEEEEIHEEKNDDTEREEGDQMSPLM